MCRAEIASHPPCAAAAFPNQLSFVPSSPSLQSPFFAEMFWPPPSQPVCVAAEAAAAGKSGAEAYAKAIKAGATEDAAQAASKAAGETGAAGSSADLCLGSFSVPTANAEGLDRFGRVASAEVSARHGFRYSWMDRRTSAFGAGHAPRC